MLRTGNDYGESSHICDTAPTQIVEGARSYTVDHPHSAFRVVLPYFIAAYKAGTRDDDPPSRNVGVAWYRTTPIHAGLDGGKHSATFYTETAAAANKRNRNSMGTRRFRICCARGQGCDLGHDNHRWLVPANRLHR